MKWAGKVFSEILIAVGQPPSCPVKEVNSNNLITLKKNNDGFILG